MVVEATPFCGAGEKDRKKLLEEVERQQQSHAKNEKRKGECAVSGCAEKNVNEQNHKLD